MVCREPDRFDWDTTVVPLILHGLLGVEGGHVAPHGVLRVEGSLGFPTVEAGIFPAPVVDESPPAPGQVFAERLLLVVVPPALGAPGLGLQEIWPAGLTGRGQVPHHGLHTHRPRARLAVLPVVVVADRGVETFLASRAPELFL